MNEITKEKIWTDCLAKARRIFTTNLSSEFKNVIDAFDNDYEKFAEHLYHSTVEREVLSCESDVLIDYNDEITEIIDMEEEFDMIDITVSGANLFYANGILTKNSHGLSMTSDLILAGISTEALEEMQQIKFKQLKNRYCPIDKPKTFIVGLDREHMRLYNVSNFNIETTTQKSNKPAGFNKKNVNSTDDWLV